MSWIRDRNKWSKLKEKKDAITKIEKSIIPKTPQDLSIFFLM